MFPGGCCCPYWGAPAPYYGGLGFGGSGIGILWIIIVIFIIFFLFRRPFVNDII